METIARNDVVRDLLQAATLQLEKNEIHRPGWTAEQLLSHRLGSEPFQLWVDPPVISKENQVDFEADVAARASGVPLQYVMGTAAFYGREFEVGPGVFIPRPETEVLVEVALSQLAALPKNVTVADIGTGSGAIAITMALECPGLKLIATDISAQALHFAKRNARRHGVSIEFREGDGMEGIAANSVDLIVSNPPYLHSPKTTPWPRELHWEPWIALDGGAQGLDLVEKWLRLAAPILRPQGKLLLEIGHGQTELLRSKAPTTLRFEKVVQDLAGLERGVLFSKMDL